jgi:acyl carrier protein
MTAEAFLRKLSEILEREADAVTAETPLEEGALDSLAILSMIAAIDEEFGVVVPTERLKRCRSVGEVLALAGAS